MSVPQNKNNYNDNSILSMLKKILDRQGLSGGAAPIGPAGGSLTGTYPNPTIATIPSGATGTTQSAGDNSTKIATTAYADAVAGNSAIGSPVTGGTANRVLYIGATGNLAQHFGLQYSGTGTFKIGNLFDTFLTNIRTQAAANNTLDIPAFTGTDYPALLGLANIFATLQTVKLDNLLLTVVPALKLHNTTAATALAKRQNSPAFYQLGTNWKSSDSSNNIIGFRQYISGGAINTLQPNWNLEYTIDGTNFVAALVVKYNGVSVSSAFTGDITSTGAITSGGGFQANAGGISLSAGGPTITINPPAAGTGYALELPNAPVTIANSVIVNNAGTLSFEAKAKYAIATKTVDYIMTTDDCTILVDTTAGDININLPNPTTCSGQVFNVKKIVAANNLNIGPLTTGTIDGAATITITSQWENTQFQSNGTDYFIL